MSVAEAGNSLDPVPKGILREGEFDNLLNILDFPMESFEDDGFVADWDITKSHSLGLIPSDVLLGPPPNPDVKVDTPSLSSGPPITEPQEQKQASNLVEPSGPQEQKQASNLVEPSGPVSILPNKLPEAQEPSVFQTQSPVSVLESSGGSSSSGKNAVPVRGRSKRLKRASSWLSPSTYFITDNEIPVPRKETKEKKKKKKLPVPEVEKVFLAPNMSAVAKRCTHCQVNKTPQWREGPLGPKTLCNACGVRYRSGRLLPEYRPAASPTFVPALHSNSHKKVVEIRSKGKGLMAKTEEPPASPQPEFVPMSNYLFDYIY